MASIKTRLTTLERNSKVRSVPPPLLWGDSHGCMVENHGGFILPVRLSEDEWSAIAEKQQRELIASLGKP